MMKMELNVKGADRARRNLVKAGAKLAIVGFALLTASFMSKKASAGAGSCFLKGTKIRTTNGEKNVEDLSIGEVIPTMLSGNSPIQWIGRYSYIKDNLAKPWAKEILPVRIARSAFAPNVPHSDLVVTQAHAIFIGGVLVPACSLINGTTISLYEVHESLEIEVFHIKLKNHDVIYAEGAPCETLLQVSESANNYAEYFRLFGMPSREEIPCFPLIAFNGGRSEIKSRLRSALSPIFDRRQKIDVFRDRLEEQGLFHS